MKISAGNMMMTGFTTSNIGTHYCAIETFFERKSVPLSGHKRLRSTNISSVNAVWNHPDKKSKNIGVRPGLEPAIAYAE